MDESVYQNVEQLKELIKNMENTFQNGDASDGFWIDVSKKILPVFKQMLQENPIGMKILKQYISKDEPEIVSLTINSNDNIKRFQLTTDIQDLKKIVVENFLVFVK